MKKLILPLLISLAIFSSVAMADNNNLDQRLIIPSSQPVVSASPAYTSGDNVGGKLTFSVCLGKMGTAEIRGVMIWDLAKQGQDLDLVLFRSDPASTTFTDNSSLDIADGDIEKIAAVIPITTQKGFNDNGVTLVDSISVPVFCNSSRLLYGAIVARNASTLQYSATTDLSLALKAFLN